MSSKKTNKPPPPQGREPGYTKHWSAKNLQGERKTFENKIKDLDKYVRESDDSRKDEAFKRCQEEFPANLPKGRAPKYWEAILRYIVSELVVVCRDDGIHTRNEKLDKSMSLVKHLFKHGKIGSALINKEFEAVCEDIYIYPTVVVRSHYDQATQDRALVDLSFFANFNKFALQLYREKIDEQRLLTSLKPADMAIRTFTGRNDYGRGNQEDDVFEAICQWLIYAHKDIYNSVPWIKNDWGMIYEALCTRFQVFINEANPKEIPVKEHRFGYGGLLAQRLMGELDIRVEIAGDRRERERSTLRTGHREQWVNRVPTPAEKYEENRH